MSVPEWVRRKSGTMFNCHPPFAYESTASTLPDYRIATPPLSTYHEYPIHSFSAELARRASAPLPPDSHTQDDAAAETNEEGVRREEVIAALFSSPKRAATAPVGEEFRMGREKAAFHDEQEEDEEEEDPTDLSSAPTPTSRHPSLPDLLASTPPPSNPSNPPPPSPTTSHHEAITPGTERCNPLLPRHHQTPYHPQQETLHCPNCGVTLMLSIDEGEEASEQSCPCVLNGGEEQGMKVKEMDGPVQVLRGAW